MTRFDLPHGFLDVFDIAADDRITPYKDVPFDFPKELAAFGTLEKFRGYLATLPVDKP